MREFLFVGLGGFIGSYLRYVITKGSTFFPVPLPLGTLISNVIAGILIGFIIGLERNSLLIPPRMKLFLTTGLLGGLSTFSTFSLETIDLFMSGKYLASFGNITLNLGLSLLGVLVGMTLSKALLKTV